MMKVYNKKLLVNQAGFSLVELLVGLVIGLLATLVIMQVFSAFEGQKRTTTGGADAQTNGSVALHSIERTLQNAGFGLPVSADQENFALKCSPSPTVDHDGSAGTPNIGLFPIEITDGNSDTIMVRYSVTSMGSAPVKIIDPANATTSAGMALENNIGCQDNDVALISLGTSCVMTTVADANGDPDTLQNVRLAAATPGGAPIAAGAKFSCMGTWQEFRYEVLNNELVMNGDPVMSEIVNMQAQYGISATADSNQVVSWVDPTGGWAAPSVADRNRIKAVRIAVVARNGLLEKDNVTVQCTTAEGTTNNGPCAWDDTGLDPAPEIDLSGDGNWQRYRYKAFETVIPLRNLLWSKDML